MEAESSASKIIYQRKNRNRFVEFFNHNTLFDRIKLDELKERNAVHKKDIEV